MELKKEKIGIFGGTFNPIHNGHIEMAKLALDELNLDKLYIVPVGIPSHRSNKELISGEDRLEMVRIAFEEDQRIIPCDYEISLRGVSYTYDTLLEIRSKYKNSEFYEIIGEDSAEYLETWRNYKEMKEICTFVYFKRDGHRSKLKDIKVIEAPLFEVSSTKIREYIYKSKSLKEFLPKKIIDYIIDKKLYN